MKNRKFSKKNDKEKNTIIEIRKEILIMLRGLSKDLDRELYNSAERTKINEEVKEIALLIRDKDMYTKRMKNLQPLSKEEKYVKDDLIRETRKKVRALLKLKIDAIVPGQYDQEELSIVYDEIEGAKQLVYEKDRLIIHKSKKDEENDRPKVNPHLAKYFKKNLNQDSEYPEM